MKERILFVCSENKNRSPTAESLYENSTRYEARSCGISQASAQPVTEELIKWADKIIVMESWHADTLLERFPGLRGKEIINLNVPDIFIRDDPRLVKLLKERLGEANLVNED
jgi:predicted protein tyrosine phosphatase